jgi:L-ribulose-5-phosphate 3-epimerase
MKKKTRRHFLKESGIISLGLPVVGSGLINFPSSRHQKEKIQICIFSKHLQFLDYDGMADTIAEIGLDGADLTVRPGGHVLPENVERDLPMAITAIQKRGLVIPMITTSINDPDNPLTDRILKIANQQGVRYYRMGYYHYSEDLAISETIMNLRSKITGLVKLNTEYSLHGAYQNHAGNYLGAPVWDLWMLINGFEPDYIGCQYDIRHATVEGGSSWPLGLKLINSYIRTVVIKDFRWEKVNNTWRTVNVPLGEGMVDFSRFFGFLKEFGFSGPISMHFEYPFFDEKDTTLTLNQKRKKAIEYISKDFEFLKSKLAEKELI